MQSFQIITRRIITANNLNVYREGSIIGYRQSALVPSCKRYIKKLVEMKMGTEMERKMRRWRSVTCTFAVLRYFYV